ncbi:MAG TPA: hypothetical protein VMF30_14895 [Pirellulales bacterium]|nr:hypothetical protein [Pirellulales bacterium]
MAAFRKRRVAFGRRAGMAGHVAGLVAGWAGYLLLAGSLGPAQVIAGGVLAGSALAISAPFQDFVRLDLRLGKRELLRTVRIFMLQLFPDTWRITGTLWIHLVHGQRPTGRLRRLPLEAGDETPIATGRRALLLYAASWAPNTVAIAIDDDSLVLHQLVSVPAEHPHNRAWPI